MKTTISKTTLPLAFTAFAVCVSPPIASAALAIASGNGSFETNGADTSNDFFDNVGLYELVTVGGTIPGWTFNTPGGPGRWFMEDGCGFGLASNGSAFINLSNAIAGYTASSTISGLDIGQSYTLTFDASLRKSVSAGSFTAELDLTTPLLVTISAADLPANAGLSNYEQQTITFIATNTTHTLTLDSANSPGDGFIVDNFAVIPEPSAALLGGLGLLALLRRRSK
jgi:hypothetical protein